ncbi:hypothetical protein BX600DRAFT_478117 [Xylariales sp. PMI_506]|nr:hypothetical protein BX600DRAFT_478117 [Xylariales sp. PMI_506]
MVRQGLPKVKTGCFTCRIRKIKCDEGKPGCQKCVMTGRKCTWPATSSGLEAVVDSSSVFEGDNVPLREKRNVLLIGSGTVASGFVPSVRAYNSMLLGRRFAGLANRHDMSDADAQALDHYRCVIAQELEVGSGRQGGFWSHLVLQIGQDYAMARLAIIALSHTFRSVLQGQKEHGLGSYNKAIRHMLSTPAHKQNINVTLVVSLIFSCLEAFRGNTLGSSNHFQYGCRILNAASTEERHRDLLAEFFRIDYLDFLHGRQSHSDASVGYYHDHGARPFSSLEDAHFELDQLLSRTVRLARKTNAERMSPLAVQLLDRERTRLRTFLASWEESYSVFCSLNSQPQYSNASYNKIKPDIHAALRCHYLLAKILSNINLHHGEMTYDQHSEAFSECVDVVAAVNKLGLEVAISPTFANDIGLAMFFIANKCRKLNVRIAALQAMLHASLGPGKLKLCNLKGYYSVSRWIIEREHGIDLEDDQESSSQHQAAPNNDDSEGDIEGGDEEFIPRERRIAVAVETSDSRYEEDDDGHLCLYKKIDFITDRAGGGLPTGSSSAWLPIRLPKP